MPQISAHRITTKQIIGAITLCLACSVPTVAQTNPEPSDLENLRQTMSSLRTIGSAVASWHIDRSKDATDEQTRGWPANQPLPIITEAQLRELVVPKYLDSLELKDGWGNPIEARINPKVIAGTALADKEAAFAFISAGQDGVFQDGRLHIGCYHVAEEPNADIGWTDGYFVNRPSLDPETDCANTHGSVLFR